MNDEMQVLLVKVSGAGETVRAAMDHLTKTIADFRTSPAPIEIHANGAAAALAEPSAEEVSQAAAAAKKNTVTQAVAAVRKAARVGEYQCRFCDYTSTAPAATGRHESKIHPAQFREAGPVRNFTAPGKYDRKKKSHVCDVCGKTFRLPNGLTKHMSMTHGKAKSAGDEVRAYACGRNGCFETFTSDAARSRHWVRDHA